MKPNKLQPTSVLNSSSKKFCASASARDDLLQAAEKLVGVSASAVSQQKNGQPEDHIIHISTATSSNSNNAEDTTLMSLSNLEARSKNPEEKRPDKFNDSFENDYGVSCGQNYSEFDIILAHAYNQDQEDQDDLKVEVTTALDIGPTERDLVGRPLNSKYIETDSGPPSPSQGADVFYQVESGTVRQLR